MIETRDRQREHRRSEMVVATVSPRKRKHTLAQADETSASLKQFGTVYRAYTRNVEHPAEHNESIVLGNYSRIVITFSFSAALRLFYPPPLSSLVTSFPAFRSFMPPLALSLPKHYFAGLWRLRKGTGEMERGTLIQADSALDSMRQNYKASRAILKSVLINKHAKYRNNNFVSQLTRSTTRFVSKNVATIWAKL